MRKAEWESGMRKRNGESGMGKRIGERRRAQRRQKSAKRGLESEARMRKWIGKDRSENKKSPAFPAGDKGLLIKLTDGMYVR